MGARTFWNEERRSRRDAMLMAGASYQAIGDAVGTTRNSVAGSIKRDNPPRPVVHLSKAAEQPIRVKRKYTKRHNDGAAPEPMPMPEPIPGGVPTMDLGPRQCRYVFSDGPPWLHCAADAPLGSAWCERHRKAVYQPQRSKDAA